MSDFRWDGYDGGTGAIKGALENAFADLLANLTTEFTKVISTPGLFAGYEGDIVDTGYFRSSLNNPTVSRPPPGGTVSVPPTAPLPKVEGQDLVGEFTWHAEYSLLLHEPTTTKSGKSRPGRPWTEYTLENYDALSVFEKLFLAHLQGRGR